MNLEIDHQRLYVEHPTHLLNGVNEWSRFFLSNVLFEHYSQSI